MYTQCSSCKTLFRITDEQLASVGGKVRCGFCYGTFNAYDALFEELPDIEEEPLEEEPAEETVAETVEVDAASTRTDVARANEREARAVAEESDGHGYRTTYEENWPPTRRIAAEPAVVPRPAHPALPATRTRVNTSGARSVQGSALPDYREPDARAIRQAHQPAADHFHHVSDLATAPPTRNTLPTPPRTASPAPPVAPTRVTPPLFPFAATEPATADGPAFGMLGQAKSRVGTSELPRLFDAIDMAGKELQQVTRGQLDRRPRHRTARAGESRGTFAWALATLLLVAFIVVQYGYFMRNDLARFPQLRPWLEKICEVTGCTIPLMYSPHLIKLVSRDIRTHPTEKDALQVRARILNEAPYPQAFPVLSVELSDMNGKVIASRLFHPGEYLAPQVDIKAGIASKAQTDIQLDLLDPSHAAVGFEFAFL